MGSLRPPSTTGMMRASHASRRIVSGPTGSPVSSTCPGPSPRTRSSRRMVTAIVGRPGSAPTARRMTSASAAARRWAAVRVGPPEARSARQSRSYSASTAALTTAPSSLVYKPSSTVVPSNVARHVEPVAFAAFSLFAVGVGGQQPVPQHHRGLVDRQATGMLDERPARRGRTPASVLSLRCAAERQQRRLRQRQLTARQCRLGHRHRPQPPGRAHHRGCRRPAQLTPVRQPRRPRRRTVIGPHPTSISRGHRVGHRRLDPAPLGIERAHMRGRARHRSTTQGRPPTPRPRACHPHRHVSS